MTQNEHPASILIIEDQVANLQLLMDILVRQQIRVLIARDGTSGIKKASYAQPDLILLDVQLPGMNGFATCRQLKANSTTKQIPVIFLTSHAPDIDHKLEGFAAGSVDYLTRPIQEEELLARIGVHLQLRKLTRSLEQQTKALKQEIDERIQIEAELTRYKELLEMLVMERTAELQQANRQLRSEIEERKQAEQQLQYERNLLQTIFDGVSAGLALLDQQDRILIANRAMSQLLHQGEPLLGQGWTTIAPEFSQMLGHARQHLLISTDHRFYWGKNGNQHIFDVTIMPISLIEPTQLLVHMSDITEQIQLEAVALQNERFAANGRLAASVAHEVNSPLQAIQNFLYLISIVDEPERSDFLKLIHDEIDRIGGMLRRLMDFRRTGDDAYQFTDIHELIERILLLTSGKLAQQHIRVERSFYPELPHISIRPDLFTQIMLNIVLNAIDAMPHGGVLTITTAIIQDQLFELLQVAICDNGHGIEPIVLERIFEPFFTTKPDGNGIGLAVTNQLMHQLGGSIQVQSQLGQGTIFTLRVPATARTATLPKQ